MKLPFRQYRKPVRSTVYSKAATTSFPKSAFYFLELCLLRLLSNSSNKENACGSSHYLKVLSGRSQFSKIYTTFRITLSLTPTFYLFKQRRFYIGHPIRTSTIFMTTLAILAPDIRNKLQKKICPDSDHQYLQYSLSIIKISAKTTKIF